MSLTKFYLSYFILGENGKYQAKNACLLFNAVPFCWNRPISPEFFFYPKKKIVPRNFSIFCRFETAREKISKTAREEKNVPEKKLQNSTLEKKEGAREKMQNFPRENAKNSRISAREK